MELVINGINYYARSISMTEVDFYVGGGIDATELLLSTNTMSYVNETGDTMVMDKAHFLKINGVGYDHYGIWIALEYRIK